MSARKNYQETLRAALRGHWSHADAAAILGDLTVREARSRPGGVRFSIFQELCHLTLCQRDILEAIEGQGTALPVDEAGLWPGAGGPKSRADLQAKVQEMLDGLAEAERWISRSDETIRRASWEGSPVARGLQVLGNHNSYHLGRIALLKAIQRQ